MMPSEFRFHETTLRLLPQRPPVSEVCQQLLGERERQLGVAFPASVREWYSLEGAVELLRAYSNQDHPIPLAELGDPFLEWYGHGKQDFLGQGLLVFLGENQGVCQWAVRLDGTPDPPVVVATDPEMDLVWDPCVEHFSTFLYCQIWDYSLGSFRLEAQDTLSSADLSVLRREFRERPVTHGWPGVTNYRFESDEGRVLIWDGEDRGVDWHVAAPSPDHLPDLLAKVWPCGQLANILYYILLMT